MCDLRFNIDVSNSGRGLAEDIFFGAELTLPDGGSFDFHMEVPHDWRSWRGPRQFTMMSKAFPPLPPGSDIRILVLRLAIPFPVADDVVVALTCGSRNGPGAARTIFLPSTILAPAVEHYTHPYGTQAQKGSGDQLHEGAIKECLK